MASTSKDVVLLTAHCLCKANTFSSEVPKSQLPLQAYICHCDSCRHVTGALHSVDLRWPTPRAEVNVSKLKVFHLFPSLDLLFCPTCSSPIFFVDLRDTNRLLGVFTGVLKNEAVNLVEFVNQIFVHDTIDGGASAWLRHNFSGSEITRFRFDDTRNEPEELPQEWPPATSLTGYEDKKEDAIPIRCKCKGVDLILHRGDYTESKENELPFNIDPKTHKLLAGFCGCDSCRLQSGVDLFNWTFAQIDCVSFGNSDKPFPSSASALKKLVDVKDPALGTLTYYSSRKDVERYFCSKCSACIFYAVNSRPRSLDIAIGVLEASDGARAEGLLSWPYGARISYREDGDGGWREKLFDSCEKAAEQYRIARQYPKNWNRIAKDENGGRSPE
ncbi:hypothetical protein CC86DRAFT_51208 [Ophiobolus disseminans]|uniref:CENP-V/GFA domain-containing protein n=1 Tax=Ophiobolus disseminans TaxID=1469910 RepID=A0A6A6ZSW1_9PLEO|nr:hypothetical protein CC86DRAFT_51208 [Ophiobolus disseminans]